MVTAGPYRVLRHPSYAGALLICAGIGLASANLAGLDVLTVLPLALLLWRIRRLAGTMGRQPGQGWGWGKPQGAAGG